MKQCDDKISVIVPVYNVERYLRRCLDSIVGQTYQNLEIILIDDGSNDESGDICEEYARQDKRIIVFHTDNNGPSASRNYGLDRFTGDYVCMIDSDDYCSEDFCEIMHEAICMENADMAICRIIRFSGDKCERIPDSTGNRYVISSYDAIKNIYMVDGETYILTGNKFFKKEVVKSIRYPIGRINEDEFTTYKFYLKSDRIVFIDSVLNFYYRNEHSITTNPGYYGNLDVYDAYDERKILLKEKGNMEELIRLTSKAYLDRIIYRCRYIYDPDGSIRKSLYIRYKKYYKANKQDVSGFGYPLYYYSPKLYYFLLTLKGSKKIGK